MDIKNFKTKLNAGGCVDLTGAHDAVTVYRSRFGLGYYFLSHYRPSYTFKRKDFAGFAAKANKLIKELELTELERDY